MTSIDNRLVRSTNKDVPKIDGKWAKLKRVFKLNSTPAAIAAPRVPLNKRDELILRWTSSCLTSTNPMFTKVPQFNMVYCTLPSLTMFVIIAQSADAPTRLYRWFAVDDTDLCSLSALSQRVGKLAASRSVYTFVRFLVDEEPTTTVSRALMDKCNRLARQQVFASIRTSRVLRYLSTLCFSASLSDKLPRPSRLTTNAYGSCGIRAHWCGKAVYSGMHRFLTSYGSRKMEHFILLRSPYRRVVLSHFEVIQLDVVTSDKTRGALLILRPHCLGDLPRANTTLSLDSLAEIVHSLATCAVTAPADILLPSFIVHSRHDVWKNLAQKENGVAPDLGQSAKLPPIASAWHWTSLAVTQQGIGDEYPDGLSNSIIRPLVARRVCKQELETPSKSYAVRIDSPFTYILTLQDIPLLAGSYYGTPSPQSSEMFVRAPQKICKKKKIKIKKKTTKKTRRQKLREKASKNRSRTINRERKKMEKLEKKKEIDTTKSSSDSKSSKSMSTTKRIKNKLAGMFNWKK